ncbi:retrovirus-related pol polyprotein from transposon TNT 1-94 [Tanacetum coccineum]
MANLLEDIQCAGSDTRPPMLDRTDFASWQQRICLYCRGKENGVNILKSIDEGPFQMGTFRETLAKGTEGALHLGPERPRVYFDLSPEDKERYNADIRATNIIFQGLPKDIYSLINHYTDAKDIWDNVKMLLEGSKLTKEDRESQLYDDFEHFRQYKGETIHDYYVRFAKLINDMRNIKMTMSRMQLNSKFVNNMLPEWGRFVTAVKLNRGLRDSNYDQLYAYLKQHEAHANENKMMLEQFTQPNVDPLALMTNVSHQQYNSQSSTNPSSTYVPPHFADNTQLGRQNKGQGNNARGAGAAGYGGAQNRVGNANPGQAKQAKCYNCNGIGHIARNCTQPKHPQNSEYFKDKMLLMQAQENGVALDEEHLLFIADDDCDAFDFDVDEAPTAQTMCMANLSSVDHVYDEAGHTYDSDILSENPLCLTRAKQVQPALYNGYEMIKNNHVSALVHNTEDTLEIAEITRRKINDKMKDPECVTHKVKITPPDYSKENYLATFTPKKQLTLEQIFWSQDLMKMKEEALKKVLPTKSQVKINIFALIQLFLEFEKTCKKRVTPTGLTKGERGFEQTLKEHFKGIQKALTKEIKEMKDIFKELEAEVDQNVINRKHDQIERKNLLITNDNLIDDFLSKGVFYIAMNYELTVSRFTEMHEAHTIVQTHCLELEAELSKLRDKVQKDDHT